jgi:pyruvate formate lyase activating enzyme
MIFDIKRYAIHDGPGIRTTVFFKGCPLACPWCHNPEGVSSSPQLMWWPRRCLACGDCSEACSEEAISFAEGDLEVDRARCTKCGECAAVCCSHALQVIGRTMTPGQVMEVLEKDRVFYEESGGGVTFSGGEPLMQQEFLHDILRTCRQHGIHTVVDTSGYTEPDTLLRVSDDVDMFLYDLKIMNDDAHKKYTGVSNEPILENLRLLSEHGSEAVVRLSLIPNVNDDVGNIGELGAFVASLKNVGAVHILPYHRAGISKAKRLGESGEIFENVPPSSDILSSVENRLRGFGLEVWVGG